MPELTAEEVLARYPGAIIELLDDLPDRQEISKGATDVLPNAGMEARRQRVLAILAANHGFRYAVITDSIEEPGVVVHIGIRGVGSGEIVIAKDRYNGLELLSALENREAK